MDMKDNSENLQMILNMQGQCEHAIVFKGLNTMYKFPFSSFQQKQAPTAPTSLELLAF